MSEAASMRQFHRILIYVLTLLVAGCGQPPPPSAPVEAAKATFYGTLEPFAAEAVYFVVTDRFVNGDPDNDHRGQGGDHPTFDIPLPECDGVSANIGYLGGDFMGLLDSADYIREMGFTAVWITPIVDNPDQAFTGGDPISCTSVLTDRGKTGYHGYWGINFYTVDEHLPSEGLDFEQFTAGMRLRGLKTVLDIVGNHGSPAWTQRVPQQQFGQVFDAEGRLLADHGNLPPDALDRDNNPLHRFFHPEPDLAQLGKFDTDQPEVLEYLAGAYLQWIEQGAAAFRIDTIAYQPHRFWKEASDRIRAEHPDFFMFGEAFNDKAEEIAVHTWPENGGISVLDFPLRRRLVEVFENPGSDYALLADALFLDGGPYQNPYELATFYDNHDMARMNAADEGFIDAHNWLFTARGIPVIYYGSEMGFMRGRAEHAGNRNYFGREGIEAARNHPIRTHLARITAVRASSPALQKGLQLNLELAGDRASFYRVFQHEDVNQIALVLLNKGDAPTEFIISEFLEAGLWRSAFGGEAIVEAGGTLTTTVDSHGVEVYFLDASVKRPDLSAQLAQLMSITGRR